MSLGQKPPYVLIVQEDERERDSMRKILALEYEVRAIGDGFEVLSEVISRKPDLLLVDLVLPGIPGLEVIHALQSTRQKIPIIATVGGDRRSEDWLRASIMGAAKLLRKPISAEELRKWTRSVLNNSTVTDRSLDADDAASLLLDHGKPKIVAEEDFSPLLSRARRMDLNYDQVSTVLLIQSRNYIQRDQLTEVAAGFLRSGDYILPYRQEKHAVLLPLTRPECVPSIIERISKAAGADNIRFNQLRCGAMTVEQALCHDGLGLLFGELVPWGDCQELGALS